MIELGLLVLAGATLAPAPSFAQTVGHCPSAGAAPQSKPAWVLFDLGSATFRPEPKPVIAEAAATAKARQSSKLCIVGQTDKLGDKNDNAKLARARSQSIAGELVRAGYPAKNVVIASNPEAFGTMGFGGDDASEKDRRVTIISR